MSIDSFCEICIAFHEQGVSMCLVHAHIVQTIAWVVCTNVPDDLAKLRTVLQEILRALGWTYDHTATATVAA